MKTPPSPLSSRPQWRDLRFRFLTANHQTRNHRTLCHPACPGVPWDRSGASAVLYRHTLWMEAPPSPLSSRPERSEVEGPAVPFPNNKSSDPEPTYPLSSRLSRRAVGPKWRDLQFCSLRSVFTLKQLAFRVLGDRLENNLAILLRIHFSPNLGNRPVRCDKESIPLVEFHILEGHQRDTIGARGLPF